MLQNIKPILGISIGTRTIGIAIIRDKELIHWQTKRLRNAWSQKKCELLISFIEQLICQYKVIAIGVKVPPKGHYSKGLIELISELCAIVANKGIPLKSYRIQELKRFCSQKSLNRIEMMQCIIERFTFLNHNCERELNNRHSYHIKMFEGILAGLCMQAELQRGRKRSKPSFLWEG